MATAAGGDDDGDDEENSGDDDDDGADLSVIRVKLCPKPNCILT